MEITVLSLEYALHSIYPKNKQNGQSAIMEKSVDIALGEWKKWKYLRGLFFPNRFEADNKQVRVGIIPAGIFVSEQIYHSQ